MRAHAHERFSTTVSLSEGQISSFALAAGDANPLHHDARYARSTRYGGLIASGPQTSSILMGLVATHFARGGPMVGLEFTFYFRTPVPAEDQLHLEWLVVRVSPTSGGAAEIAELRGRLRTSAGVTAVGAKGLVLLHSSAPSDRPAA